MTIDLYTWTTPNGRKVSVALEELGLPYENHMINISKDEQFAPDFLKISPNNKIPAIVDPEGPDGKPISLFETGAILLYLADKTGKLMPKAPRDYWVAMQWLMWQMGGFGPMLGQAHHFLRFAPEKLAYAIERYSNEAKRLYGVADRRLGEAAFLGGDEYTIADMAAWPWMRFPERQGIELDDYPNLKRWRAGIAERPAVAKAITVLAEHQSSGTFDAKQREMLFGATQYQRR